MVDDDKIFDDEKKKRAKLLHELPPIFVMAEWSLDQLKLRIARGT